MNGKRMSTKKITENCFVLTAGLGKMSFTPVKYEDGNPGLRIAAFKNGIPRKVGEPVKMGDSKPLLVIKFLNEESLDALETVLQDVRKLLKEVKHGQT